MKREHHRKRLRSALFARVRSLVVSHISSHPKRSVISITAGLILVWLVVSKSLPYVLATSAPDTALALNPNNPVALVAKAEDIREQLLVLTGGAGSGESQGDTASKGDTIAHLPEAEDAGIQEPGSERDALRRKIGRLAVRALANDPLNAKAYRLLAETTDDPDLVRILMREAVKRSRHETVAQFWLLNDSAYQKDFGSALDHADILLRTRPDLSPYVFAYLTAIAEDPAGFSLIVQELAKGPGWRPAFFVALPRSARQTDTHLKLMTALRGSAQPIGNSEIAPYLNALIAKNLIDAAYNAWLQFLPKDELDTLGLLTHANFERDPSGLAFDWQIGRGVNAISEFVPVGPEGERALHVAFGTGRVKFPEVRQTVLLPPGRYRLEGKLRGWITANRGLRWQLTCASGSRRVLGETDMLIGRSQQWRIFALEADVPQTEECRGQILRFFHDSRSASEELISGEAWVAGLRLERIPDPSAVVQ
ncbi:hypothetical protein JDN40_01765 [Rhodomicrobium vannielii ATCC 17100]|uniref:hypothetical protein n=1 Tax=Rhodomicrobium vannielii TaxID=1069 RepID=UPI001918B7A8|nr:hypothetical protein [Rhodomicrobium vannielii]MBJ7532844.1 hypothetical protein [Rhodomicrobium vannielii ATCC 17100]